MREGIRAIYYNKQKYHVTFKMKNTEAVRSTFPTSMLTGVSPKQRPQNCILWIYKNVMQILDVC